MTADRATLLWVEMTSTFHTSASSVLDKNTQKPSKPAVTIPEFGVQLSCLSSRVRGHLHRNEFLRRDSKTEMMRSGLKARCSAETMRLLVCTSDPFLRRRPPPCRPSGIHSYSPNLRICSGRTTRGKHTGNQAYHYIQFQSKAEIKVADARHSAKGRQKSLSEESWSPTARELVVMPTNIIQEDINEKPVGRETLL